MRILDKFLGGITMYRLILIWLVILDVLGMVFCLVGWLNYSALDLLVSTVFLLAVSLVSNKIFARIFKAADGTDSVYITALILALIITPTNPFSHLGFLAWAAVLATASKYVLAWRRRHIFNPAAIAVVITSLFLGESASWWVGNVYMLPVVIIGGFLIIRQIRRFDLIWAFFATVAVTLLGYEIVTGGNLLSAGRVLLLHSPLLFFAFAMLSEPLTTPPTKSLQMWYGAITGFLFLPQLHFGSLYFSPEMALVVGNFYSWVTGPKTNLLLTLKSRVKLSPDTYEYVFANDAHLNYTPGQYMEWTIPHQRQDDRGNRRFITVSSAPEDGDIKMGVKFYPKPSTYKRRLLKLKPGDQIAAGHLSGDFVLPEDKKQKLVFVAGGIGITPFASMLRHMLHAGDRRDAILIFANWREQDIAYRDLLEAAATRLGMRVINVLSAKDEIPENWSGRVGFVDSTLLREEIPDFMERTFYISGPQVMVAKAKKAASDLGIHRSHIRTDYFPGFA